MTPEQIAALGAAAKILEIISTWPVAAAIGVIVLGPWVMVGVFIRGQEKRFEAVRQMYENNVDLVREVKVMADERQELVILNTTGFQELSDLIRNNLFCPIVRKGTRQTEASG